MTGHGDDADRWADAAERGRRRRTDATSTNPAPWRSLIHSLMYPSGPAEMQKEAEMALGTLPVGSVWRVPALLVLAAAQALGGDGRGADATLRDAADIASSVGAATLESAALGLQSLVATDRGEWVQADELAAAARSSVEQSHLDHDVTSLFAFAASARAALRQGDWTMVRADLERADALLPRLTSALGSFSVYLRMEFARVRLALGDVDGAHSLVEEIEGIFARRPRLGVFRQEVDAFKVQISEGADRAAGTSPLTAAELRLLPLLTTHLSFREIADRLYVSRNTVKTQAISVYRKLGVSSRGDAIARASDLGLIADDDDGAGA